MLDAFFKYVTETLLYTLCTHVH